MSVADTPDLKAALDWYGEEWRPFLPPEEQLVGHIAWDRIWKAANQILDADREWICHYPEFNDTACLVEHRPKHTAMPRKHLDCGWYLLVKLTDEPGDPGPAGERGPDGVEVPLDEAEIRRLLGLPE